MTSSSSPIQPHQPLPNVTETSTQQGKQYQCEFKTPNHTYTLTYLPAKGEPNTREHAIQQFQAHADAMIAISSESFKMGVRTVDVDLSKDKIYVEYEDADNVTIKQDLETYCNSRLQGKSVKQANQKRLGNINSLFSKMKAALQPQKRAATAIQSPQQQLSVQQIQQGVLTATSRATEAGTVQLAELTKLHMEYQKNENEYLSNSLDEYAKAYDNLSGDTSPGVIRTELYKNLDARRKEHEIKQDELFGKIKKDTVELMNLLNETIDPIKRSQIKSAIEKANRLAATGQTNNSRKAVKGQIVEFQAVVDKKIRIEELKVKGDQSTKAERKEWKKLTKQGSKKAPEKIASERKKLPNLKGKKLRKSLKRISGYENELASPPTTETMQRWGGQLKKRLNEKTKILDIETESPREFKTPTDLAWGRDYVNNSLVNPGNWTKHRSAIVAISKNDVAHVCVTELEPQNIRETEGGAPSGLRNKTGYDTRATNFIRSTICQLDSKGGEVPGSKFVSFRGGQFPTKEAAKEALISILKEPNTKELHISALLTPSTFNLSMFKKDLSLLNTHRKNILEALVELEKDVKKDPNLLGNNITSNKIQKIREELIFSNIGVNEGAVGELRPKGIRLPSFGWHSSVHNTNKSIKHLNKIVEDRLDQHVDIDHVDLEFMDRLGAIVQVGQEMEEIWARNDFAKASVGDNQFKMASNWKVMDNLLGITSYVDCMSGKDRTGAVESNANYIQQEISMNIADHKRTLRKVIDDHPKKNQFTEETKKILASACFQVNDVKEILDSSIPITTLNDKLQQKMVDARKMLGAESGDRGFMKPKRVIGRRILPGRVGISSNKPLSKDSERVEKAKSFAPMMGTSVYAKAATEPKERHREARHRRLQLQSGGSIEVTQMNTGKPGLKVKGGRSLLVFCGGFDREHVLNELEKLKEDKYLVEFENLTGIDELDEETRNKFNVAIMHAKDRKEREKILMQIEDTKFETLAPQAVVSS